MNRKINKIFRNSKRIKIDNNTKLVIMSDCHRGIGNNQDNFMKNKDIFETALRYYYTQGFTYIELGDGDEMWEIKNYNDIINKNINTFKLIKKFYTSNRFIMLYGNHDICKKYRHILKKYFYYYNDLTTRRKEKLLLNLTTYESLILDYNNYDIFIIHGHQADIFNSSLWKLSRFIVRYIWNKFELIGIEDPTHLAKNNIIKTKMEKRLEKWSRKYHKMIIAGHTHRPVFPKAGNSLYFNDGSCIHPNGITCIEICNGTISLINWVNSYKHKYYNPIRIEIGKKENIINFF